MKKIVENILLIIGLIIILFTLFIFKTDPIAFMCSVVAIITAFSISKGKAYGNIFGVFLVILYSIVSYNNKLYGEVIIYLFILLPLYIYSAIVWYGNLRKENKTVIAYDVSGLEWAILSASEVLLFTIVYILLNKLHTNQLLLSTFSFVSLIYTVYLSARRSKYSFLWYLMNDIVILMIWSYVIISSKSFDYFPLVISISISCLYDIYGIIWWDMNNKNIVKVNDLDYRKLSKSDKKEFLKIVEANENLIASGYTLPYSKDEKDSLFNENEIFLYGVFDKNKLVGKSELHFNQNELTEIKKILNLEKYKVCMIRRVLDVKEYSNKEILRTLIELQIKNAKEMAFNYIVTFVNPNDILCKKAIKATEFTYVKTDTLRSGEKMEFYVIKV